MLGVSFLGGQAGQVQLLRVTDGLCPSAKLSEGHGALPWWLGPHAAWRSAYSCTSGTTSASPVSGDHVLVPVCPAGGL